MKHLKTLLSASGLVLLVLGVPWVLIQWGHTSALLSIRWPSVLTQPVSGRVFVALLSLVGWIAWAVLTTTVIQEVVTALRRGPASAPTAKTSWLRLAVRPLVVAALAPLMGIPAMASAAHAVVEPYVTAASPLPSTEARDDVAGMEHELPVGHGTEGRVYVTQAGDELWTIAEQHLGSGERWREILRSNPGLSLEQRLTAGTRLVLPENARFQPPRATASEPSDTSDQDPEQSIDENTEQNTEESTEQGTEQSSAESPEQSAEKSTEGDIEQNTEQGTTQDTAQDTEHSTAEALVRDTAPETAPNAAQTTAQDTVPDSAPDAVSDTVPSSLEPTVQGSVSTQTLAESSAQAFAQDTPRTSATSQAQDGLEVGAQVAVEVGAQTAAPARAQVTSQEVAQIAAQTAQQIPQTPALNTPQTISENTAHVTAPANGQVPAQVTAQVTTQVAEEGTRQVIAQVSGPTTAQSAAPHSARDTVQTTSARGAVQKTVQASVQTVVVQRGDTLSSLAAKHLGDPDRWPEIFQKNRHRISDPDSIDVGWQLLLPTSGPAQRPAAEQHPTANTDAAPMVISQLETPVPSVVEDLPLVTDLETPVVSEIPHREEEPPLITGDSLQGEQHQTAARAAQLAMEQLPAGIVGPVSGMLAAGIFATVAARRRGQLLNRAVGTRLLPLTPQLQRFITAIGRTADPGLTPLPTPTTVQLGWEAEEPVVCDLERHGVTTLVGSHELTESMAAAFITSLMCMADTSAVDVVAVEPDESWDEALDDPRMSCLTDPEQAVVRLVKLVAQRRVALGTASLDAMRADPNTAAAFAPTVMLFCRALSASQRHRITQAMALGNVGVSVVLSHSTPLPGYCVDLRSPEEAHFDERRFTPQLLEKPARRAVLQLFHAVTNPEIESAPWWNRGELPSNVTVLPKRSVAQEEDMPPWSLEPTHPTLLLLGDVALVGCRGTRPNRAQGQCVEYCAWLLQHPAATPTSMASQLMVAETTRRSNMSRLRTWLGMDEQGQPYLPDAYTGRIELHQEVTSDWERFEFLVSGGVNQASNRALTEALRLVRGEPLQGVSFQWPWAEELRLRMISMIADAAVVLADRHMNSGNYFDAMWALDQGRLATGDDETLATRRIHILALQGDREAVDREVRQLTRTARSMSRDLSPETTRRIQYALHTVLTRARASTRGYAQ